MHTFTMIIYRGVDVYICCDFTVFLYWCFLPHSADHESSFSKIIKINRNSNLKSAWTWLSVPIKGFGESKIIDRDRIIAQCPINGLVYSELREFLKLCDLRGGVASYQFLVCVNFSPKVWALLDIWGEIGETGSSDDLKT